MEIKIGMMEISLENLNTAEDYKNCMSVITRWLFRLSGLEQNSVDIAAMADNMHRFLVENPKFVVGLVNAGKIKIK